MSISFKTPTLKMPEIGALYKLPCDTLAFDLHGHIPEGFPELRKGTIVIVTGRPFEPEGHQLSIVLAHNKTCMVSWRALQNKVSAK